MKQQLWCGLLALVCLSGLSTGARSEVIYGLTANNELITFDSTQPSSLLTVTPISQTGIIDIDFSPANGQLYGSTSAGSFYNIDVSTGLASLAFTPLSGLGTVTDFDFNPAADRVRVFSAGDQNYRLVPDASAQTAPTATGTPGTVINDGTFSNTTFELVANAYSNNFDVNGGATTLYSIDTTNDALVIHSNSPQFSTVTQVGLGFGVSLGTNVGFDVSQSGVAYLSNDSQMYIVDLNTGTLTDIGGIGYLGLVTSIATPTAVPEPGSIALVALVSSGIACKRWRRRK